MAATARKPVTATAADATPASKPAARKPAVRKTAPRKPAARPPALPSFPDSQDDVITIGPPDNGEEPGKPARVPVFSIGGTVYTMLADPPPTLSLASLNAAAKGGGPAFGEIYAIRAMLGSRALNALIEAGEKGWVSLDRYDAIVKRVRDAAFGPAEDEDPNP